MKAHRRLLIGADTQKLMLTDSDAQLSDTASANAGSWQSNKVTGHEISFSTVSALAMDASSKPVAQHHMGIRTQKLTWIPTATATYWQLNKSIDHELSNSKSILFQRFQAVAG